MKRPDVIIVGAGIVGAACAHELAVLGLSVHVIDARLGGATNAGMGHLVAMDGDPAELALSSASLATWHEWGPRMNADAPACAYGLPGTLWIAADEEEAAEAAIKSTRLLAAGVDCDWLDGRTLADAEPALRPGLAGALRVKADATVYAPCAAEWLLRSAGGAILFEQAQVDAIDSDGVLLIDGSRRDAGAIVLAAGTDSARLCPELPLRPRKGHLAITDRYPGTVRHALVELAYVKSAHGDAGSSVAFNVQPRPTGQLLIGSSRQFDSASPQVEQSILGAMLRKTLDYLPTLASCNVIRTWTGFRAATPDGLPMIGPHPWRKGLWLAVGHEGLGVTTAPATARLIASDFGGEGPALERAPYAAVRFELREAA